MLNCIAMGRVLPERASVRFGPVKATFSSGDVEGTGTAYAEFSIVSVHMDFNKNYDNHHNIVSIAKSLISPITNYIAFSITASYEVIFDTVIDLDHHRHFPVSVSEPFFNVSPRSPYTFARHEEHKDIEIPISAFGDGAVPRALEELSNALKRPHLSPMYCRLAIETIRSSFDSKDESVGWEKLRAALNVRRETIDTFWSLAADQRHGRAVQLDWDKRKNCLMIAWELTNRFLGFKTNPGLSFERY